MTIFLTVLAANMTGLLIWELGKLVFDLIKLSAYLDGASKTADELWRIYKR